MPAPEEDGVSDVGESNLTVIKMESDMDFPTSAVTKVEPLDDSEYKQSMGGYKESMEEVQEDECNDKIITGLMIEETEMMQEEHTTYNITEPMELEIPQVQFILPKGEVIEDVVHAEEYESTEINNLEEQLLDSEIEQTIEPHQVLETVHLEPTAEECIQTEQVVFGNSSDEVEGYEDAEITETIEMDSEECISETVADTEIVEESILGGLSDFTPKIQKPKQVISKDGTVLEINQLSNIKKIYPANSKSPQSPVKRPLLPGPGKNIITKVIIQHPTNSNTSNQSYKIIGGSVGSGQPRSLTLAQAQQLGLITPGSKIQQILPGGNKRMIVKKIIPTSNSGVLSPTKILPAPGPSTVRTKPSTNIKIPGTNVATIRGLPLTALKPVQTVAGSTQIRPIPVALSSIRPSAPNYVNIKPSIAKAPQQKVIIRQGQIPIKSSTVLAPTSTVSGQVIRIPPQGGSFQPIQIGGKQLQYVKLVSAPSTGSSSVVSNAKAKIIKSPSYKTIPIAPNPGTIKAVLPKPSLNQTPKRILFPVTQSTPHLRAVSAADLQLKTTVSPIPVSAVQLKTLTVSSQGLGSPIKIGQKLSADISSGDGSIVILPSEIMDESKSDDEVEKSDLKLDGKNKDILDKESIDDEGTDGASPNHLIDALEANGMRMKKPCNCTRSQCLKLYCECFANGEFCYQCNCINCFNNISHEGERQKSIKSCLDRNPDAFRPKIQLGESEEEERKHNKGCHCKRSGCLKNYCECYEAKITCSRSCKCVGCRNTEEFLEGGRSGLIDLSDVTDDNFITDKSENVFRHSHSGNSFTKQPYNFMSSEVIEATCQCLMAQAEEAIKNDKTREEGERMIIEEFGRCLVQIIECTSFDENA